MNTTNEPTPIRCDTLLCGAPALWVRFLPGSAKTPDDTQGRKCGICYERNQLRYHYPESGWEMIQQSNPPAIP